MMRGVPIVHIPRKTTVSVVLLGIVALLVAVLIQSSVSFASPVGTVSQSISTGALSTDIKDSSQTSVPSPSFAMSSAFVTTSCQNTSSTYGTDSQRIYVDNPGDADNGWSLSIAATNGVGALWESGSDSYDYDDPSGSGCTNGQLTLDPSAATLTMETGTSANVTQGAADSFNAGSSITLLTAAAASDDIWRGYLTGIGVSQTIPASTPPGSYSIDLTQTVISN